MNRKAGGFADAPQKGKGRPLAVCAGDMHDATKRFFRIAERGQQSLDAPERQVDDSRVIRPQPFDEMITPQRGARLLG